VFNGQSASINVGDEIAIPEITKLSRAGIDSLGIEDTASMRKVKVGLFANFLPVVSADGGSVRLHFDLLTQNYDPARASEDSAEPGVSKLTLDKVTDIPNETTVVYRLGSSVVDCQEKVCPAVLARIPYLNRLFTNVVSGSQTQEVFVLVTPRVIVNDCERLEFEKRLPEKPCVKSSRAAARDAEFSTVVYPVAHLVVPQNAPPQANVSTQESELMRRIAETVSPAAWAEAGGQGTMQYYPPGMGLVVRQTPAIQRQVAELLGNMKRLPVKPRVLVESLIVTTSSAFAEFCRRPEAGQASGTSLPADGSCAILPAEGSCAFLSDIQLAMCLEAIQGDRRTNVMTAPQFTVLSGSAGEFSVTDEAKITTTKTVAVSEQRTIRDVNVTTASGVPIDRAVETVTKIVPEKETRKVQCGVSAKIVPYVSADRQSVRLALDISSSYLQKPRDREPELHELTLSNIVSVPDSGTVVYHLGSRSSTEQPNPAGPPILSKIPYMNRLFTNAGSVPEEQVVFLFVTTRVLDNEQATAPPSQCPCPVFPR
jgi:type II secretory pathway component GspD/PulD (secretin)